MRTLLKQWEMHNVFAIKQVIIRRKFGCERNRGGNTWMGLVCQVSQKLRMSLHVFVIRQTYNTIQQYLLQ